MANQRRASRVVKSLALEKAELAIIDAAARAAGMTRSQYLVEAALAAAKARATEHGNGAKPTLPE